jgi:hypothetical protein
LPFLPARLRTKCMGFNMRWAPPKNLSTYLTNNFNPTVLKMIFSPWSISLRKHLFTNIRAKVIFKISSLIFTNDFFPALRALTYYSFISLCISAGRRAKLLIKMISWCNKFFFTNTANIYFVRFFKINPDTLKRTKFNISVWSFFNFFMARSACFHIFNI